MLRRSLLLLSLSCASCFSPNDPVLTSTGAGSTSGDGETFDASSSASSSASVDPTGTSGPTSAESSATLGDTSGVEASSSEGASSSGSAEESEGSSGGPPSSECGNGDIEAGEVCDDGVNAGADVGDCAPDCSAVIELREIISSAASFSPNLAALGGGTVIENLDAECPFGYRAMFSDGEDRVASLTSNTGDGQVDWVLAPWRAYVNGDGDLLAITDGAALLGVRDGAFSELANAIEPGDLGGRWTGLNQDWTALEANENCNNWTSATANYQMMTGIPNAVDEGFLRQSPDYTYPCNNTQRPVYCVEQ